VIDAAVMMEEVLASVFAAREELTVSAWADRYRHVVVGARKGPWRTMLTPYLREIQDLQADPDIREITVMKPTQTGGTEAIYNGLFWSIDQEPVDTLFVYPTKEDAQFNNRKRFLPTVRRTPQVRKHLSANKRDALAGEISFARMVMRWVGSNSESPMESYPWGRVIVDEVDRCEPGTIAQVRERMKTFPQMKLIKVGSPGDAGVGIDREYNGALADNDTEAGGSRDAGQAPSDQRRWFVPCPCCGVYHHRTFDRVRWDGGKTANPMAVRIGAWFECPSCRSKIEAVHNLWQSVRGVWCPRGMDVTKLPAEELATKDEPVSMEAEVGTEVVRGRLIGERPRTDHAGFAIGGLDSTLEVNPYGAVAAKFVQAGCIWTRALVNRTLGRAWVVRGEAIDIRDIRARIKRVEDGGYGMGTVPRGVLAITAAIDVQQDGCWVEILGWSAGGAECWMIEAFYVKRRNAGNLVELDALWSKRWTRVGDGATVMGPKVMGIVAAGIDSGKYTDEVYTAVRRWRAAIAAGGTIIKRIWPVKGEQTNHAGKAWRTSVVEKREDRAASAIGEGLELLLVNTGHWKEHVHARLRPAKTADQAGDSEEAPSLEEETVKPDVWHFPIDTPGDYLSQMTAEQSELKRVHGNVVRRWSLRPGRSANHFLDCRVYNCAVADKEGVRHMPPEKTAAAAKPVKRVEREKREPVTVRDRIAARRESRDRE